MTDAFTPGNAGGGTPLSATSSWKRAWLASACLALSACSGGDGCSDTITLGASQGCGRSADSATVDFPVFYVKRPQPDPNAPNPPPPNNVLRLLQFEPGADLYTRSSASPSAGEVNLTGNLTQNLGDVRDVDVSYDGKKVVFAMRFPFRANTAEAAQPASWDIYEYDISSGALRGVLVDPLRADPALPRYDDRFPHYLPDGRILFTSTRQRSSQAVLLDEGKPQYQAQDENNGEPAFVLHVMDANGGNIRQISFNQSHDMDAAVLNDGRIVFSRWDGASAADHVELYSMNPDGSKLRLLYGKQPTTHATGTDAAGSNNNVIHFLSPRPMLNGFMLTMARPFTGTDDAGDLLSIDVNTYVENSQATLANAGMQGPAQQRLAQRLAVYTTPGLSPDGRFRSAFPLADGSNRLLVSWTPCRVFDNGVNAPCSQRPGTTLPPAAPLFGAWIYNPADGTQLPVVAPIEGLAITDIVAAQPRTTPAVILDRVANVDYAGELATQAAGVIDIKSVYDIDGVDSAVGGILSVRDPASANFPSRPARFLRIEKAVSLPNAMVRNIRNTSFSPAGRFMREIVGYAPIEPDGSVRVKAPANVALQLSVVDRNARRISSLHRNWLQLRPGEVLTCNGCHNAAVAPPAQQTSHGRDNLFASVNPGAPGAGLFPNTDATLMGNPSDTMAQTRASVMCRLSLGMSACNPSVNVIYDDLWTDPSNAGLAKEASFDHCYSAGLSDVGSDVADLAVKHVCASRLDTPTPTPASCESRWTGNCRAVINYVQHIQPLWEKARPAGAVDNQCIACHASTDAANQTRVPAGQLDLSATPDAAQPDHLTSYRKLLFTHNAQQLNGTMLQDICLQTDPITGVCIQFQTVTAPMTVLTARGARFFTAIGNATHAGFMTEAELRLISEWLDIGAQYYNDPFLAPTN